MCKPICLSPLCLVYVLYVSSIAYMFKIIRFFMEMFKILLYISYSPIGPKTIQTDHICQFGP